MFKTDVMILPVNLKTQFVLAVVMYVIREERFRAFT